MSGPSSHFVAVLEPSRYEQARTRRLLAGLGLPAVAFGRAADLVALLARGRRFSMLVLSFGGSLDRARLELERVKAHAGPRTPLMLLMPLQHVELASAVMGRPQADFLLAPFAEDELQERLRMLFLCHADRPAPRHARGRAPAGGALPPCPAPGRVPEDSRPMAS